MGGGGGRFVRPLGDAERLGAVERATLVAFARHVGGDLAAQRALHVEPALAHVLGDPARLEHLAEDHEASLEVSAEDRVRAVCFADGTAAVRDARAEVLGRVLVLEALHALPARATEVEADHHVVEAAIDETIDDRAEHGLSTDAVEVRGHRASMERERDGATSPSPPPTPTPTPTRARDAFSALGG